MNTFILPGGSVKNKEWLEETADKLMVDGFIRPVYWEHWGDSEAKFDKEEKANLIAKHTKGDKINIIAKSIGSLVASYVIDQIPTQINKVIICGIPVNDIGDKAKEVIKKALESLSTDKLIVFQNNDDPHGTFAEVREFLPNNIKVISKERDDHHYPYYEEFNGFLTP